MERTRIRHIGFFEGIGGFSIAAEWMGWDTTEMVEIDPFCQKILKKRFPNATIHGDIKTYNGKAKEADIVTGGFPCQPFSFSGKRKGSKDPRALWHEFVRVIDEIRPTWVVGENVGGFANMEEPYSLAGMEGQRSSDVWYQNVAARAILDLNTIGYDVPRTSGGKPILFIIPACAVGASHERDRVWIIARSIANANNEVGGQQNGYGGQERQTAKKLQREVVLQENGTPCTEKLGTSGSGAFGQMPFRPTTASEIAGVAYGISGRVDRRGKRMKALGNAIVPQVAYYLFHYINLAETSWH